METWSKSFKTRITLSRGHTCAKSLQSSSIESSCTKSHTLISDSPVNVPDCFYQDEFTTREISENVNNNKKVIKNDNCIRPLMQICTTI